MFGEESWLIYDILYDAVVVVVVIAVVVLHQILHWIFFEIFQIKSCRNSDHLHITLSLNASLGQLFWRMLHSVLPAIVLFNSWCKCRHQLMRVSVIGSFPLYYLTFFFFLSFFFFIFYLSQPDWEGVCGVAPESGRLEAAVATKDLYMWVCDGLKCPDRNEIVTEEWGYLMLKKNRNQPKV